MPELAAVTGAMLENLLKVQRSGWLLLTPQDTKFQVSPVAGRGQFPIEAAEFSRNNPLLRQLDLQRQPILQPDFRSDPKYGPMPPEELAWLNALQAEAYVPVFDAGLLAAVLVVGERNYSAPFRPADIELLQLLASHSAAALKAARVIADLKKLNASMISLNESLQNANETMYNMNSVRSDFLAIASHELRTPITQMLGFADLLGSMAQDNSIDPGMVTEITRAQNHRFEDAAPLARGQTPPGAGLQSVAEQRDQIHARWRAPRSVGAPSAAAARPAASVGNRVCRHRHRD